MPSTDLKQLIGTIYTNTVLWFVGCSEVVYGQEVLAPQVLHNCVAKSTFNYSNYTHLAELAYILEHPNLIMN